MLLNTGHHHLRVPKLGGSAQTLWWERPNSDKLGLQPRALQGQTQRERLPNSAGALKLGGSAQTRQERPNSMAGSTKLGTWRKRPHSATVMMYL